jgi:hypothetical protein
MNNNYDNFEKDVKDTIAIYKKAVGGFASNTERILDSIDKVNSLSKLMQSGDIQKGFRVLRDNGQLDRTFEALVIKYKQLFKQDIIGAAQWRLDNAWELDK